jgi:3-oxoacyl-[acyl-carrier protein] reductase
MIGTPLTEAVYQDDALHQARRAVVPLGRIGTADDVGEVVAFLTSPGAAYVTGQALTVDGGVAEHMLGMIPGRPGKRVSCSY